MSDDGREHVWHAALKQRAALCVQQRAEREALLDELRALQVCAVQQSTAECSAQPVSRMQGSGRRATEAWPRSAAWMAR